MAKRIRRKAKIVVGSRGSQLALTQTLDIIKRLGGLFPEISFELKVIKTKGDKLVDSPLSKIGGKGLFTKEIEQALLRWQIDFAVHSLKDLPTEMPKKLVIGSIPKREDPRDMLIESRKPNTEHRKLMIGTSSLRRQAQVLAAWPQADVVDLRGNLDTRIRKLEEGQYDAIVVAAAGVKRLRIKRKGLRIKFLSIKTMLPAPGQGALAIECRAGDERILEIIQTLNHHQTDLAVTAERALLFHLGGGCQVPIGASAKIAGRRMKLEGVVADIDGSKILRDGVSGSKNEPEKLGEKLARRLIKMGARKILNGKG